MRAHRALAALLLVAACGWSGAPDACDSGGALYFCRMTVDGFELGRSLCTDDPPGRACLAFYRDATACACEPWSGR